MCIRPLSAAYYRIGKGENLSELNERKRFVPFFFFSLARIRRTARWYSSKIWPARAHLVDSAPSRLLTVSKSVTCQPVRKRNLSSCMYMCSPMDVCSRGQHYTGMADSAWHGRFWLPLGWLATSDALAVCSAIRRVDLLHPIFQADNRQITSISYPLYRLTELFSFFCLDSPFSLYSIPFFFRLFHPPHFCLSSSLSCFSCRCRRKIFFCPPPSTHTLSPNHSQNEKKSLSSYYVLLFRAATTRCVWSPYFLMFRKLFTLELIA